LLRRLGAGFFSLPSVSSLEGFFLRFLFGIVVASTISLQVPFHDQPHPVGLARLFDPTSLSDPKFHVSQRDYLLSLSMRRVGFAVCPSDLAIGHPDVYNSPLHRTTDIKS
jgi:hypothetical protein